MEPSEMSAWDCGESVQDKQHAKKKEKKIRGKDLEIRESE